MYLNKAIIIGNLTRDPELKTTPGGAKVVSFSLATNRTYKGKDGSKQEEVAYHNIVAWGKTAELIAQYLKKGSQALVEGRLQTRSWEKDGAKQYRTEIVADTVQFGSRPAGAAKAAAPAKETTEAVDDGAPGPDANPDDIPF